MLQVAEIQLLGTGAVVDMKAALGSVQGPLCMLMEGNRFWNVVAMRFTCRGGQSC